MHSGVSPIEVLLLSAGFVAMFACGLYGRVDAREIQYRLIRRVASVTVMIGVVSFCLLFLTSVARQFIAPDASPLHGIPLFGGAGILLLISWLGGTLGYATVFWVSKQGAPTTPSVDADAKETGNPYQPPSF